MKIHYVTLGDVDSVAYLDDLSTYGEAVTAQDKYTDAPVTVQFNTGLQRWEECRG